MNSSSAELNSPGFSRFARCPAREMIESRHPVPPGRLMGELGFAAPKNRRTQTIQCLESGDVLSITYETLLELYFQNPEFGYYLLSLTSERLLQNISRLEGALEDSKAKVQQLERGLSAAAPR